jgi:uncharacterized protein (TIGR02302 family)
MDRMRDRARRNDRAPTTSLAAMAPAVRRTRAAILIERLARRFWPLATLIFAAWSLVAFGALELLTPRQGLAALALVAAAALLLGARGAAGLRWPTRAEALARIDARLPERPIAAMLDIQALGRGDAGATAIWEAHRARMAGLARQARAVGPDLRLSDRDPWGLRLMALVMLFAALLFARSEGLAPVSAALAPSGSAALAGGPAFEAWARPPAYTGRPNLYLPEVPGDRPVRVPEGTEIAVLVYGGPTGFSLTESVSESGTAELARDGDGVASAAFTVERTGSVTLREGDRDMGAWSFIVEPDLPPEIELAAPVARASGGATRVDFAASDDYGIAGARVELEIDLPRVDRRHGLAADPTPRPPLEAELPLPMTGRAARGIEDSLVEDFSTHPWAGLPVRVTLTAEDAIGQQGADADVEATLPRRRFFDPAAAALVEQRRDLLWSPENVGRVTQVLRALTHRPEDVFSSPRAYLLTRTAIRWLDRAAREGVADAPLIDEVAETLWQAALLLEEGGLGDAAERLARAQERLREALRGDADDAEVAELMEELREATRDYMQRLAEEAVERGETRRAEGGGGGMGADQIQELMNRIQELSEQGRRAEAEALLEVLRQLLENMEVMLAEGGEGGGQGQALEDLADTLREQQELADESFQELQREFRRNREGLGEAEAEAGRGDDLAGRQESLRQGLDDLRRALPGARGRAGEAAREALRGAERDMADARDRLRNNDMAGALDRQADALERLREGMRGIGEDMRQAEASESEGGGEGRDARSGGDADPLGREFGGRGQVSAGDMVPEADARARARALLDEIRRRAGELDRPEVERDYLRRLLDRF